jgi:hypothetical protein
MAGTKLPHSIVDERIQTCYDLRYKDNNTFTHVQWQAYCHEHYNDKSEQQYTAYWMSASNLHKDYWREKLDAHISPAVDKMIELLASDDEKVAQKAIEHIMKYTGNDVQKIEADINLKQIDVKFDE